VAGLGWYPCGRLKPACQLPRITDILDVILNNVRQHNYFITQGNYIGYMFRLFISHLQAYFVNYLIFMYFHECKLDGIPICA